MTRPTQTYKLTLSDLTIKSTFVSRPGNKNPDQLGGFDDGNLV